MGDDAATHGEADGDLPPLSSEETAELVERYRELVYKIAHRLHESLPEDVPIDDLVGWGYTGLIEAYRRYDESQKTRFGTYAYYRIRGAMIDACPDRLIDPSRRKTEIGCNEVLQTYGHVVQNHDNMTTLEDRLSMLSDVAGSLLTVYVLGESPDSALRPDGAPQKQKLVRRQNAETMRKALKRLGGNERTVLEEMYFNNRTLTDIAEELGLSPSWASRLHSRALDRLRKLIEKNEEFADLRHAIPV